MRCNGRQPPDMPVSLRGERLDLRQTALAATARLSGQAGGKAFPFIAMVEQV